jgi:nucleoside phosphorylase
MSEHRFLMSLREAIRSGSAFVDSTIDQSKLVGLNNLLNEDITSRANDLEGPTVNRNEEFACEILVIAPLFVELRMAALAFGCDFDNPVGREKNLPHFEVLLNRRAKLSPIKVRLATLNRQTNVRSGPRTATLLSQHRPRMAILTGIAGTREDQSLGEVHTFETVTYVSGGVEVPNGKQPQDQQIPISEVVYNMLQAYADQRSLTSASSKFRELLLKTALQIDGETPTEIDLAGFTGKFSVKKLMSGETLRKDGQFSNQALHLDRQMTMVEMEAAGFAYSCQEVGVDWAVFRGGCDYANPAKNDVWQRFAALNSALAVRDCLECVYRNAQEISY